MSAKPTSKKAPVRKKTTFKSSTASRPKSRVGSTLLKSSTKRASLFTKRNGIIAGVMAAIAGLAFVALSFAGGTPDYQYSVSAKCAGQQATQSCKDKSAEAAVYRMYKGILGYTPDSAGYAFWTQLYAGDRTPTTTIVNRFLAQSAPKAKLGPLTTNEQFVGYLQKNFTGKTAAATPSNYWVKQLKDKKMTRNDVARKFIFVGESVKYHQAGLSAYLATAAPVAVKQTALDAQNELARKAKVYAAVSTKELASAKAKFKIVEARYKAAKKLGDQRQSDVSQGDITNAESNASEASEYAAQVRIHYVRAQDAWNKSKVLVGEARRRAQRSPDITTTLVIKNAESGRKPTEEARQLNSQAQTRVGWANQSVAQAKQKYAAEQARLAEIRRQQELAAQQAAQEGSGGGATGGGNITVDLSGEPAAPGADLAALRDEAARACAAQGGGTARRRVAHGYALAKRIYSFSGRFDNSGAICEFRYGSFVAGSLNCDAGYKQAHRTDLGRGCVRVNIRPTAGNPSPTRYYCKKPNQHRFYKGNGKWGYIGPFLLVTKNSCDALGGIIKYTTAR